MEQHYNNRDFERFLKQNADQYRMIPSERIWEGINDTLHTRKRRWLGFGLALLVLTAGVVTWVMMLPPAKRTQQTFVPGLSLEKSQTPASGNSGNLASERTEGPKDNTNRFPVSPEGLQLDFFTVSNPAADNEAGLPGTQDDGDQFATVVVNDKTGPPASAFNASADLRQQSGTPDHPIKQIPVSVPAVSEIAVAIADIASVETPAGNLTRSLDEIPVRDDINLPAITEKKAQSGTTKLARKSLTWHLYVTPTVSYRTLSENIDFIAASRYNNAVNGGPAVYYPSDVNTMVNHRPDLGFQLGIRTAYPVSRWFNLTGGLQFTVSKYDIKAYQHPAEMATIALMDRSVSTVSNFRNTNGYKENWLRNFYFSASLPIGAELKLSDGNKSYFGMGATLQPTYVIDNRAYLISADYKNYAEMPSLTRRWNMNTSFEVFSAHTTGKVRWRVGPQVRYQLMSSFDRNYPIKEHLFDFGLKLGIQLK
ncbi:MAG: hypothetical protein ACO25B_13555 [Chitinophagaceae bacterium]